MGVQDKIPDALKAKLADIEALLLPLPAALQAIVWSWLWLPLSPGKEGAKRAWFMYRVALTISVVVWLAELAVQELWTAGVSWIIWLALRGVAFVLGCTVLMMRTRYWRQLRRYARGKADYKRYQERRSLSSGGGVD